MNEKISYRWIRSRRKTASIEINENLEIVLRTPMRVTRQQADAMVEHRRDWIANHLRIAAERKKKHPEPDEDEILALRQKAQRVLPEKVAYYASLMGVEPVSVKITSAKKRFGSCSPKNGLCFSLYLMKYPESAVDYVVVHELAHIRQKNHSRLFYREIASVFPDYREREKLLRE